MPTVNHAAKNSRPKGAPKGALGAANSGKSSRPRFFLLVDKYVFAHLVAFTLAGLTWSISLLLLVLVVTALRRIVDNQLSFNEMAAFMLFQTPRMILLALPMSVLYGTLQTFAELSKNSEYLAFGASGVSLPRMLRAPLLWGALLTIFSYFLQEFLVPQAEMGKEKIMVHHLSEKTSNQTNFRYEDPPNGKGPMQRLIQAERYDVPTNSLIRPRIQIYNDDHQVSMQIIAEKAQWQDNAWVFFNGITVRLGGAKNPMMTAKFQRLKVDLPTPQFLRSRASRFQQYMQEGDFLLVPLPAVARYRRNLETQLQSLRDADDIALTQKLISIATYGLHDKIATPLICLVLVLVGAPLGVRPPRATGNYAAGMSLLILVLYYIFWTWDSALGRGGIGHPLFIAYLPLFLTACTGALLVWRKSS